TAGGGSKRSRQLAASGFQLAAFQRSSSLTAGSRKPAAADGHHTAWPVQARRSRIIASVTIAASSRDPRQPNRFEKKTNMRCPMFDVRCSGFEAWLFHGSRHSDAEVASRLRPHVHCLCGAESIHDAAIVFSVHVHAVNQISVGVLLVNQRPA